MLAIFGFLHCSKYFIGSTLQNRIAGFSLPLTCALLVAGCDAPPPQPLPYQTTPDEEIRLVYSDYYVSRFWSCGWTGNCPVKRWAYCLHIVPKNEDAAFKWYRIYNRESIEHARWERTALAEGRLRADSLISESEQTGSMSDFEQYELSLKIKYELIRSQLDLIEQEDPAFKHQLFIDMKEGIHITSSYSISKAGTPDQSTFGWMTSPDCLSLQK